MSEENRVDRVVHLATKLAELVADLTEEEFGAAWESGVPNQILTAIQDPEERNNFDKFTDYLLAKKSRLRFLAAVRQAIQRAYPIRIEKEGRTRMVSVGEFQWFDDAVMFFDGEKPYEGMIGKYDGSEISFGVAARYVAAGEPVGPNDIEFIPLEQTRAKLAELVEASAAARRAPLQRLDDLLAGKDNVEANYQALLREYPWSLGLRWRLVERHEQLDGRNIPDFTGLRADRNVHDIIEVKPPFMPLFRENGEFRAEFNAAWNQCERYLDFVDREADYLRRQKELYFENARCYLIAGYRLTPDQLVKIRRKERMNPRIEVQTFEDIRLFMENTLKFVESRRPE